MVLRPEPERRGVYPPPTRGLEDVSESENHVWSLLLHEVVFSLENLRGKASKVHSVLL